MWLYQNKIIKSLEDFPNEVFGFVYIIKNNETGKFYIGKKSIISKIHKKLGKKEKLALPIKRGRTPAKKLIISESNWLNYWGSSKLLLEDIKNMGEDKFTKEILVLCANKKQLTYYEFHYQAQYNVLFVNNSYNENIQGRFFRKNFESIK